MTRFYDEFVITTDLVGSSLQFYLDGMYEESGEIAGIFKRVRRGDYGDAIKKRVLDVDKKVFEIILEDPNIVKDLIKEIGDHHWYTTRLLQKMGVLWSDVEGENMKKLSRRKEKGLIKGKGDSREDEV